VPDALLPLFEQRTWPADEKELTVAVAADRKAGSTSRRDCAQGGADVSNLAQPASASGTDIPRVAVQPFGLDRRQHAADVLVIDQRRLRGIDELAFREMRGLAEPIFLRRSSWHE
jgi:hypothetical protein